MKKGIFVACLAAVLGATAYAGQAGIMSAWPFSAPGVTDRNSVSPKNEGDIVFDVTDTKFFGWDGSNWIDFTGGAAGANLAVDDISTTYTASTADDVLSLSSSSFTVTLFTAVGNEGKVLTFVHQGTSHSQIYTIDGNASETIGGATAVKMHTNGQTLKIVSNGANWMILESKTNTAWESFTPSSTSGLGTPGSYDLWRRRVGDTLEVRGYLTVGTVSASEARVGFAATGETIVSTANIDTLEIAGQSGRNNNTAASFYTVIEPSVSYLTFSAHGGASNVFSKLAGNSLTATGEKLAVHARIPIADWLP